MADHAVNIAQNRLALTLSVVEAELLEEMTKLSEFALEIFENAMGSVFNEDYEEADRYLTTALERDILNYGYSSYNLDLHYYLGMIAVEDGRKLDAILSYMDMKSIYTYSDEDNKKKLELYKAIREMD